MGINIIKKLTKMCIDYNGEIRLDFNNDRHYTLEIAKGSTRNQVVERLRLLAFSLENDKQLDDELKE